MPLSELAERSGVSKGSLYKIEQGNPNCEIGIVFEVASLLGISLFNQESEQIQQELLRLREKLVLLPKRQV